MNHPSSTRLFNRIHRLVFLYLFRDFDKGTLDTGIEFTTLLPLRKGRVMCRAMTFNIKGLKRDSFVVDGSNRRIVNLPGRYVCYWINGRQDSATIYNRPYRKSSDSSYVHNSRNAKSEVAFDGEGLEKRAENLVSGPRRYHEIFVRLFRF